MFNKDRKLKHTPSDNVLWQSLTSKTKEAFVSYISNLTTLNKPDTDKNIDETGQFIALFNEAIIKIAGIPANRGNRDRIFQ